MPEALKDKALTVSISAYVPASGSAVTWQEQGLRYTVPGTPVAFRLVGANVVIVIQVTPYEEPKGRVTLVMQGQVWIKGENGALSYRTTLESVVVKYGERVLFFPLGRSADGRAPIYVELAIDHYNALGKSPGDGQGGTDARPADPAKPPPDQPPLPLPPPDAPGKGPGK